MFYDEEIIRIGCSAYAWWNQLIEAGCAIKALREYHNADSLILGTVEHALIHETIHIVLNRWFGVSVSCTFDCVDQDGEVSDPSFR